MSVIFSRVVAGEQDLETCDFHQEHGGAQYVTGRIWCDADSRDCMCGVEVDGFDHGKGVEMVGLVVHLDLRHLRRAGHVAHADRILDEPFIDGLCGMCHEDSALEVGLCEDIW
jgi:hypothetical protein